MENDFIMSPKVDYAFKELMQDEQIRAGFLSAVLNIPLEEIRKTTLVDTHLRKRTAQDKLGILDVRILLMNEVEFDLEMQVVCFKEWKKRSIYYWSKMYTESIGEGDPYSKLRQCISISILDFKLLEEEEEFFSCYQLCETTKHTVYTDLMKFYVIELPKLPKTMDYESSRNETSNIYLWAKFIASESEEEMEVLAKENQEINRAYQRLKVISNDEQKRKEYEARQRAIRDALSLEEQGIEKGIEIGQKQGVEIGQEQLNNLYSILKKEGRIDDLLRCVEDREYCSQLLVEYNL